MFPDINRSAGFGFFFFRQASSERNRKLGAGCIHYREGFAWAPLVFTSHERSDSLFSIVIHHKSILHGYYWINTAVLYNPGLHSSTENCADKLFTIECRSFVRESGVGLSLYYYFLFFYFLPFPALIKLEFASQRVCQFYCHKQISSYSPETDNGVLKRDQG